MGADSGVFRVRRGRRANGLQVQIQTTELEEEEDGGDWRVEIASFKFRLQCFIYPTLES